MFGSISSAVGKAVDQTIDVGKSWLSYNQSKHQFADQMAFSREQLEFQKALLKNQMQWRVEDAKAAGLHPMAVLGLSPSSFSPISAPSSSLADLGIGSSDFAGLGQNIDRAIMAGKNEKQRKEAIDLQNTEVQLALDNKRLNNELLEVELADKRFRLRQQLTPAYPVVNQSPHLIGGQGDSPFYVSPSEVKASSSTGTQAGIPPAVQWYQNQDGSVVRSMSEQAKNVNEDDVINTLLWHYDNNIIPLSTRYGGDHGVNPADFAPPLEMLPKGAVGWKPVGYNKFIPVYDWNVSGAFYGE